MPRPQNPPGVFRQATTPLSILLEMEPSGPIHFETTPPPSLQLLGQVGALLETVQQGRNVGNRARGAQPSKVRPLSGSYAGVLIQPNQRRQIR